MLLPKKRYEEDNKIIYERINNLEYIKAVSGEKYEEKKVGKQLDSTFQKGSVIHCLIQSFSQLCGNTQHTSLFYIFSFNFYNQRWKQSSFSHGSYYITVSKLNSEINKLIDSLLTLEELSSNLIIVNESTKILLLILPQFQLEKNLLKMEISSSNVVFAKYFKKIFFPIWERENLWHCREKWDW